MRRFFERLEWVWRHSIVYPMFRLVFSNPRIDKPVNIHEINSILILRYDKIGDMVVTIPILRFLKKMNPNLHLGVLSSPSNAEIARNEESADECYALHHNLVALWKELMKIRRRRYDVVLNFVFNRTTSGALIANFVSPRGIKVGQGEEKYRFYFNKLLQLPRSKAHMTKVLSSFVEQTFGIRLPERDLPSELSIDADSRASVQKYLDVHNLALLSFVALNISVAEQVRRLSDRQCEAIIRHLNERFQIPVVLLFVPDDRAFAARIRAACLPHVNYLFPEHGNADLLEVAALIGSSLFVISPDTSIIHFASAMKRPVLGLYTTVKIDPEWLPYQVQNTILTAPINRPAFEISEESIVREIDALVKATQSHPSGDTA